MSVSAEKKENDAQSYPSSSLTGTPPGPPPRKKLQSSQNHWKPQMNWHTKISSGHLPNSSITKSVEISIVELARYHPHTAIIVHVTFGVGELPRDKNHDVIDDVEFDDVETILRNGIDHNVGERAKEAIGAVQ